MKFHKEISEDSFYNIFEDRQQDREEIHGKFYIERKKQQHKFITCTPENLYGREVSASSARIISEFTP